jgi:hypothetical protein
VQAGKPAEEWYAAVGEAEDEETPPPFGGPVQPIGDKEPAQPVQKSCSGAGKPCGGCPSLATEPRYLPGTVAFLGVLEELRALHLSKTQDYGDEQQGDALANIRNGAEMVGIDHWKGGLVRAADKMQRLKTYCRTGSLAHEGVEDSLLDLAAYAVLSLVLFRESNP